MAALWITQPLTRQARNLSCCFKLVTGAKGQLTQLTQDSLPATRFFVAFRAISTCNVLMQRRRKRFNHNPAGVPQWANYDGNQKCIDGGGFSVLFVTDLVCWPFTLPESSVFLFRYPLPYLKDIMQEAHLNKTHTFSRSQWRQTDLGRLQEKLQGWDSTWGEHANQI